MNNPTTTTTTLIASAWRAMLGGIACRLIDAKYARDNSLTQLRSFKDRRYPAGRRWAATCALGSRKRLAEARRTAECAIARADRLAW